MDDFDPSSQAFVGDPCPYYARLEKEDPMHHPLPWFLVGEPL